MNQGPQMGDSGPPSAPEVLVSVREAEWHTEYQVRISVAPVTEFPPRSRKERRGPGLPQVCLFRTVTRDLGVATLPPSCLGSGEVQLQLLCQTVL